MQEAFCYYLLTSGGEGQDPCHSCCFGGGRGEALLEEEQFGWARECQGRESWAEGVAFLAVSSNTTSSTELTWIFPSRGGFCFLGTSRVLHRNSLGPLPFSLVLGTLEACLRGPARPLSSQFRLPIKYQQYQ